MTRNAVRGDLEREILERLYPGPRNVTDLVEEVSYLKKVSVQGVYKALRTLKQHEVVTIHAHTVSLSLVWVTTERERLQFAEEAYHSASYIEDIRLGKRTKASFTFHTLIEIDLFWAHVYLLLAEHIGNDKYSYSIHPHDWYYYVRHVTDAFWVKKHIESARVSRTILTHAGVLDRFVVRERKKKLGELFAYTLNENPFKQDSRTYYNIIDTFIFTAHFDGEVAERLDAFVDSHTGLPLGVSAQKEIDGIVRTKGTFVLTIENSEQKSKKMRDKVRKYFEF